MSLSLARQETTSTDWSVELVRGVAAGLVVIAHYGPMTGLNLGPFRFAYTGVDLFFVLSGFVFAPYLFGKRLSISAHLIRRFFRLYPMYAIALGCYAVLKWQTGQTGFSMEILLKHAFFLHTLESREIAFYFNPAFWSLPPEVEFYLLLPLLAAATAMSPTRWVPIGMLLAVLMHGFLVFLSPPAPGFNFVSVLLVHLPGLLIEFMLGAMAWRWVRQSLSMKMRLLLAITGVLIWWLLASLFVSLGDAGIENIIGLRGNMGLFAACAFAFMLVAWVGAIKQPPSWLIALATGAGNLSYGLYLFHNAAPQVFAPYQAALPGPVFALLCLGATMLFVHVLHRFCEAPCRQFGRQLAERQGQVG